MELSKNIPCVLVEEILKRLPLKSLLRFQCVSKSWCSLINSDAFVKMQQEWSFATNPSRHLIISDQKVFSIDLEVPGKIQLIKHQFPLKGFFSISNSCNGLVLVQSDSPVLWNPFTGYYKVLPMNEYDIPNLNVLYGFAFDSITEDYKVVKVLEQLSSDLVVVPVGIEIYSLKSDSWKRMEMENFTYQSVWPGSWRFQVHGALHSIVKCKPNSAKVAKIMAFSVETEKHYELELPSCTDEDLELCTLGECLSVISKNERQISIWVMKDYGVAKSWTKVTSLRVPYHIDSFDIVKPLMYSKDGHKVMLIYNEEKFCTWFDNKETKLVWFDLRTKTTEDLYVEGLPDFFRAQMCVSSLVSLH